MWICYLIAIVPLVAGLVLWLASKKITVGEWALSFGVGVVMTLIVHAISVAGMTSDVETWSGQINQARFSPQWVEEYQVAIYKTVRILENMTELSLGTAAAYSVLVVVVVFLVILGIGGALKRFKAAGGVEVTSILGG